MEVVQNSTIDPSYPPGHLDKYTLQNIMSKTKTKLHVWTSRLCFNLLGLQLEILLLAINLTITFPSNHIFPEPNIISLFNQQSKSRNSYLPWLKKCITLQKLELKKCWFGFVNYCLRKNKNKNSLFSVDQSANSFSHTFNYQCLFKFWSKSISTALSYIL